MKKRILNLIAIMVFMFGASSCEKDESVAEEKITSADVTAIKTIVTSGTWQVAHYFDTENDLTTDYADFTFNFNENGTIATTDGNSSLSGAWLVKSQSDDEASAIDFEVHFSSPDMFKKLSQDWEVKKYTDSQVELTFADSEGEGTSLLTFEK